MEGAGEGSFNGQSQAIGVLNFSKGEIQTLLDECSVKSFNAWLQSKGIHVIQFSPLGNMNPFYRQTGWSKDIAHTVERITESPFFKELGLKYNKTPVQMALA
ncbi:hypothetical protein LAWI1_G005558 [Lachnellula willkommii]|uniref:Uncharacterized protein n=1 Tax=Lachnellula willkommii TaxID=215461 RepID=A0A559M607_9HELO|nr:hypothetical protein LAWI1_G005558 [Lachnellula willkommii]